MSPFESRTGRSVETSEFLTKITYALSSYALTCVALKAVEELAARREDLRAEGRETLCSDPRLVCVASPGCGGAASAGLPAAAHVGAAHFGRIASARLRFLAHPVPIRSTVSRILNSSFWK